MSWRDPGSHIAGTIGMRSKLSVLAVVAACSVEPTAFRTTDRGDDRDPRAAAYDISISARATTQVRVWSNGGYVGSGDEPMTHVGFQITNTGSTVIRFDSDALELKLIDRDGKPLPKPAFVALTPLGPALVSIWPDTTVTLDSYFRLFVPPQVVARMQVRWSITDGRRRRVEQTSFVRDDDEPILDYQVGSEPALPSS